MVLQYCPWQAGNADGRDPICLDEDRKREILFGHLTSIHIGKLVDRDWDVLENDYDDSISQFLAIDQSIEEFSAFRADLDRLLQQQNMESTISTRKRSRNDAHGGGNPLTKRSRTHQREGGGKNSGKTKCNHCGKYHLGECWKLKQQQQKGGGAGNYKKSGLTKQQYENVLMIHEKDSNRDRDRDDDTRNSGGAAWRRGLSDAEAMYVLNATGHLDDESDDEVDIPKQELKRLKKEARAATRRLKQMK